jgi:hypothetical protein
MNQYRFSRSYVKTLEMLSYSYFRTFSEYVVEATVRYKILAGELLLRFNQRLRLLTLRNTKLF